MADVVITQDFLPQVGGAHFWLYEAYRRWPSVVTLLTRSYDALPEKRSVEEQFDALSHGALKILRRDIGIDAIDLTQGACLRRFWKAAALAGAAAAGPATFHCL